MPAFGFNRFAHSFPLYVLEALEDDGVTPRGFRLSNRILSAWDRFVGEVVTKLGKPTYPGLSRFLFIYPVVGGVDWVHALNAVEPGKHTATYSGAMTHDSGGVLLKTTSSYFFTNIPANKTDTNLDNWVYKAFGLYLRTNSLGIGGFDMGAFISSWKQAADNETYAYWQLLYARHSDGSAYNRNVRYYRARDGLQGGNEVPPFAIASSHGLSVMSRVSATDLRAYRNGAQVGTTDTSAANGFPTQASAPPAPPCYTYIQGNNRYVSFIFSTVSTQAFATLPTALSVAENAVFYTAVQRFQAGLLRAV